MTANPAASGVTFLSPTHICAGQRQPV